MQNSTSTFCACGCGVLVLKFMHKTGHDKHCGEKDYGAKAACSTRVCTGKLAHKKGHKAQRTVLTQLASAQGLPTDRIPNNEERANLGRFRYEVKEGEQIPAGLHGKVIGRWER